MPNISPVFPRRQSASLPAVAPLPYEDGGFPSMLFPDAMYDDDAPPSLPDTVPLARKELSRMLDIIAAVHCCWEDETLPEMIHAPYWRYSADCDALDAAAVARLRAGEEATRATRLLLRLLKKALPKLDGLELPAPLGEEVATIVTTIETLTVSLKASKS